MSDHHVTFDTAGLRALLNELRDLKREQDAIPNRIHPSAVIHQTSVVWNYAVILAGVKIGHNCSIGSFTEIGRGSTIGNYTRIGSQCFFPPESTIGNNVFVGPGVRCADDRHPFVRQAEDGPYTPEPPVIEDGAVIGLGAILLPGVRIGAKAFVAAGAIVTKDVAPGETVRCEPARPFTMSEASRVRLLERAG